MKTIRRQTPAKPQRRGFTLIELLVVISIIAVLMSLILPAINSAREAGRRTQCLNNMRNISFAIMNQATSNRDQLPPLAHYIEIPGASGSSTYANGRSWVIDALPYLDNQAIYDRWDKTIAWNAGSNATLLNDLYIAILACPNDDTSSQIPGGLSYVLNAGISNETDHFQNDQTAAADLDKYAVGPLFTGIDWNGNGTSLLFDITNPNNPTDPIDVKINKEMSLFVADFPGMNGGKSQRLGKIYDGAANTIMIGENTRAGGEPPNFANPTVGACAFVFPVDPTNTAFGLSNGTTNLSPAAGVNPYPNKSRTGPELRTPFLNSDHPQLVVVSMCDGSARTISEDIDAFVYQKLITPNGGKLSLGIPAESPLSEDDF